MKAIRETTSVETRSVGIGQQATASFPARTQYPTMGIVQRAKKNKVPKSASKKSAKAAARSKKNQKNKGGNRGGGLEAWCKGKKYTPVQGGIHAEQKILQAKENSEGDLHISINAWPCTQTCHPLLIEKSAGRTITLTITGDKGGYSADHGADAQGHNTIVYNNGNATYQ